MGISKRYNSVLVKIIESFVYLPPIFGVGQSNGVI